MSKKAITKKATTKRTRKPKVVSGQGTPVVEGLAEVIELPKPETRADRQLREFYEKYPHVVAGSVRVPKAKDKKLLEHCHGKVCDIKCVDTDELRTINVQDAFQVRRTVVAQALYLKQRRSERAKARRKAVKQTLEKAAS